MEETKSKLFKWLKKKDSIYQLIVWILSPIYLSSLPTIAFIIFMKENHIFSYDFFMSGMFGLNTFFFFTALSILTFGLLLSGSIYLIVKQLSNYKKNSEFNFDIWIFLAIGFNIFLNVSLIIFSDFSGILQFILFILGFAVYAHIAIAIYCNGEAKFISFVMLLTITFFTFSNLSKETASFVGYGMKIFNIGGDAKVRITNEHNKFLPIDGNLTLLSPGHIYLKTNGSIKIMERKNKVIEFTQDINSTK